MTKQVSERNFSLRINIHSSLMKKVAVRACMLGLGVAIGALLVSLPFHTTQETDPTGAGVQDDIHVGRHKRSADVTVNRTPTPNGAIFTRWGRSVCPSGSTRVYKGVMASGKRDHLGGSPEYLCMTKTPEWGNATTTNVGYIYGVEFSTSVQTVCSVTNAPAGLTNQDALCVVCRTMRSVQIMIPGRKSCMPGWTKEYDGYLMGSLFNDKSQRVAVCLDEAPEADEKGSRSDVGVYLWPLAAACGALPCPAYIDNAELTCVVCSQ